MGIASRRITLSQFTLTFVPFGLLLTATLLLPEAVLPGGTPNLHWLDHVLGGDTFKPVPPQTHAVDLHRAILSIWLSTLLLIPALCLYTLPTYSVAQSNYARLFWTFSFLAYLVHFWYAAFVIFGGIEGTWRNMRHPVAATNFVLTAWWGLDVVLTWLAPPEARLVWLLQGAARVFIFLVFVVTELFLRPTDIRYLGIILAVSVLWCFLVRVSARPMTPDWLSESSFASKTPLQASR
jgi:hypothetical protein